MGSYAIDGLPVGEDQPLPVRLELKDFTSTSSRDNIQVSLFLRALQLFYDIDYHDPLSYFQIAGLHGSPAFPWCGDPNPTNGIYCVHGEITFPTWHRPYLLLFEQRLGELMGDVINELSFDDPTNKADWIAARRQWRLPYWDWATRTVPTFPMLFTPKIMDILAPTRGGMTEYETVSNPLYRYSLMVRGEPKNMGDLTPPLNIENDQSGPWATCSGTSRWGIRSLTQGNEGFNNWQLVNATIAGHKFDNTVSAGINRCRISDITWRILTPGYLTTWSAFASDKYRPAIKNWTDFLSLEFIHNNLHDFIGGDRASLGLGHMSNVPVAAFDPIFYVHHCNIDRYLAIWQALNPDLWFDGELNRDDPEPTDPLFPFQHHAGAELMPYTSDDTRLWQALGYQYPELVERQGQTPEQYRSQIVAAINNTYDNTRQLLKTTSRDVLGSPISTERDVYPDYLVNIIYDPYALEGEQYNIYLFLGDITNEQIAALTTPIEDSQFYVGSAPTYTNTSVDKCTNCTKQRRKKVLRRAQVPLTISLLHQSRLGRLTDIGPETVESFLTTRLHWKAISTSGVILAAERLPRTRIFTLSGMARHPEQDLVPSEFFDYRPMTGVTKNKPWGAEAHHYEHPSLGLYD